VVAGGFVAQFVLGARGVGYFWGYGDPNTARFQYCGNNFHGFYAFFVFALFSGLFVFGNSVIMKPTTTGWVGRMGACSFN